MDRMNGKWVIEFWDFDAWNVGTYGSWNHKKEAIAVCDKMNRETCHDERQGCFSGHRFRVRSNRDPRS